MPHPSRHISVCLNRAASEVYDFVSNPANLPKWAAGLSGTIHKVGPDWIADSPMGKVKVKFADLNPFGVLDHEVKLPMGATIYNPMRVFPNHTGAELVFTLYQLPEMSGEVFEADAAMVHKDLQKLKTILEATR